MAADTSVPITAGIGTAIAVESSGALAYQITGLRLTSGLTESPVTFSASGDNIPAALAAVAAKQIRIYGWILIALGVVTLIPKEGAAGTAAFGTSGLPFLNSGASWFLPLSQTSYWTLPVNTGVNFNLSAAATVNGRVWWRVD